MAKIAHKLVAQNAFEIACEVYEVLASNNQFYKTYPTMELFVNRCWPEFIKDARRSLAQMLQPVPGSDPSHPVFAHTEHVRNEIFEALRLEGEAKGAPPLDLNELRKAAGIDPIPRPLIH